MGDAGSSGFMDFGGGVTRYSGSLMETVGNLMGWKDLVELGQDARVTAGRSSDTGSVLYKAGTYAPAAALGLAVGQPVIVPAAGAALDTSSSSYNTSKSAERLFNGDATHFDRALLMKDISRRIQKESADVAARTTNSLNGVRGNYGAPLSLEDIIPIIAATAMSGNLTGRVIDKATSVLQLYGDSKLASKLSEAFSPEEGVTQSAGSILKAGAAPVSVATLFGGSKAARAARGLRPVPVPRAFSAALSETVETGLSASVDLLSKPGMSYGRVLQMLQAHLNNDYLSTNSRFETFDTLPPGDY